MRQQNTDYGNTFISQKLYFKLYPSTKRTTQLSLSIQYHCSFYVSCNILWFRLFFFFDITKHLANYAHIPATSVLHHHTCVICKRGGWGWSLGGRRGRCLHHSLKARSRREQEVREGSLHQLRFFSSAPKVVVILSPGLGRWYTIFGLSTASEPGATRYFTPDIAFFIPLNARRAEFSSSLMSKVVSLGTAVKRPVGGQLAMIVLSGSSCWRFIRYLILERIVGGGSVFVPTVHTRGLLWLLYSCSALMVAGYIWQGRVAARLGNGSSCRYAICSVLMLKGCCGGGHSSLVGGTGDGRSPSIRRANSPGCHK